MENVKEEHLDSKFLLDFLKSEDFSTRLAEAGLKSEKSGMEHSFEVTKYFQGPLQFTPVVEGEKGKAKFSDGLIIGKNNYVMFELHTHTNFGHYPTFDDLKANETLGIFNECVGFKARLISAVGTYYKEDYTILLSLYQKKENIPPLFLDDNDGRELKRIMEDATIPEEVAFSKYMEFLNKIWLPNYNVGVIAYFVDEGKAEICNKASDSKDIQKPNTTLDKVLKQFESSVEKVESDFKIGN